VKTFFHLLQVRPLALCFFSLLCLEPFQLLGQVVKDVEAEAVALKERANRVAETIQRRYPEDPLAMMLMASLHYNQGQSSQATPWLEKALERQPKMVDAFLMLAKIAREKGDSESCIDYCRKAMVVGAPPPTWFELMMGAHMDAGRTAEILSELEGQLEGVTLPPDAEYILGKARMQLRQFQRAKEHFLRVVHFEPNHTQAYFGLFMTSQRLGQTQEAATFQKTFAQLESNDRQRMMEKNRKEEELSGLDLVRDSTLKTLMAAGQILQSKQSHKEAADCYQQAIELNPGALPTCLAYEASLVASNRLKAGVEFFEQQRGHHPDNILNDYMLGRLETRRGNRSMASGHYQRVIAMRPEWAAGYRAHAELNMLQNQGLQQARRYAAKALALEKSPEHYYLLGVACVKLKDFQSAASAIEQAVRLKPEDARFRKLLNQLNQQMTPLP
jgi:tetratricopeptide (TPR) repeat protein